MFTDHASFLETQVAIAPLVTHLNKIASVLEPAEPQARQFLSDTLCAVYQELQQSQYSPDLVVPTIHGLSAALGRLVYMNGTRTAGLSGLIQEDSLTTNSHAPQDLAELRQRFPNSTTCHQVIALEHAVQEIFSQWQSGATFAELAEQLNHYYDNFSYDATATQKYTNHDTLVTHTVDTLRQHLQDHPLPPGAKITIIGPGPHPPELDIIRQLIASGHLDPSQIDGVDMQTAIAPGIDPSSLPQDYHFHGGYSLTDWAHLVEQNPERQADLVFFFGSVNNNDPNYFQHILDFFALARSLKHDGLLVYDTASLEDSPAHLAATAEHHRANPHAAVGERESVHVKGAVAHIFPSYLIQLYFDLANLSIVSHNLCPVAKDRARRLIVAQKTHNQISVLGQLLESIIPRSFEIPASLRCPSPAEATTA